MVEQWTYHVLQMLTINTICSAVQLLFFSSSIDISQTSFKSQHVYRLGERCWKWLDPWRDGRSPDHLQDRRCAPLVHVSLPRSPALPHHDRRNSLNTIYTLPCPLYEVKLIFSLRPKVKIIVFFFRDDDPARGYIISSIFFVSGIVTFLQTVIGCRLPIIQGGTFTFVTPTLAILALDKWSRQCPPMEDEEAWAQIDQETRQEMWQVASTLWELSYYQTISIIARRGSERSREPSVLPPYSSWWLATPGCWASSSGSSLLSPSDPQLPWSASACSTSPHWTLPSTGVLLLGQNI